MTLNMTNIGDFVCLGILINDTWNCGSRAVTRLYSIEDSPSKKPMIEYLVPRPGTYAVIFRPKEVTHF
jgi:hypothetical protein